MGSTLALRCLRFLLFQSGSHRAPLVDALQPSWPHDPVHRDGGANELTGESVRFAESRVHCVGLGLEQKETKETK
jgi:hypothetical protein